MKIRAAFEAKPGNLIVEADYSQMEVACLGAASRDKVLISEVRDGMDLHSENAARWKKVPTDDIIAAIDAKDAGKATTDQLVLAKARKTAKIMTFQLAYGASAKRMAKDFGLSEKETQAFIDSFQDKYTGVADWWANTIEWVNAHLQAYALAGQPEPERRSTLAYPYGKRYEFIATDTKRDVKTRKQTARVGDRFIKNYPIQGVAGDLLKMALASLWKARRQMASRGVVPAIQIHDAIYFRMPEEVFGQKFVKWLDYHMTQYPVRRINALAGEEWWPTDLPLRIDLKTGKKWSEMKAYKREVV